MDLLDLIADFRSRFAGDLIPDRHSQDLFVRVRVEGFLSASQRWPSAMSG